MRGFGTPFVLCSYENCWFVAKFLLVVSVYLTKIEIIWRLLIEFVAIHFPWKPIRRLLLLAKEKLFASSRWVVLFWQISLKKKRMRRVFSGTKSSLISASIRKVFPATHSSAPKCQSCKCSLRPRRLRRHYVNSIFHARSSHLLRCACLLRRLLIHFATVNRLTAESIRIIFV